MKLKFSIILFLVVQVINAQVIPVVQKGLYTSEYLPELQFSADQKFYGILRRDKLQIRSSSTNWLLKEYTTYNFGFSNDNRLYYVDSVLKYVSLSNLDSIFSIPEIVQENNVNIVFSSNAEYAAITQTSGFGGDLKTRLYDMKSKKLMKEFEVDHEVKSLFDATGNYLAMIEHAEEDYLKLYLKVYSVSDEKIIFNSQLPFSGKKIFYDALRNKFMYQTVSGVTEFDIKTKKENVEERFSGLQLDYLGRTNDFLALRKSYGNLQDSLFFFHSKELSPFKILQLPKNYSWNNCYTEKTGQIFLSIQCDGRSEIIQVDNSNNKTKIISFPQEQIWQMKYNSFNKLIHVVGSQMACTIEPEGLNVLNIISADKYVDVRTNTGFQKNKLLIDWTSYYSPCFNSLELIGGAKYQNSVYNTDFLSDGARINTSDTAFIISRNHTDEVIPYNKLNLKNIKLVSPSIAGVINDTIVIIKNDTSAYYFNLVSKTISQECLFPFADPDFKFEPGDTGILVINKISNTKHFFKGRNDRKQSHFIMEPTKNYFIYQEQKIWKDEYGVNYFNPIAYHLVKIMNKQIKDSILKFSVGNKIERIDEDGNTVFITDSGSTKFEEIFRFQNQFLKIEATGDIALLKDRSLEIWNLEDSTLILKKILEPDQKSYMPNIVCSNNNLIVFFKDIYPEVGTTIFSFDCSGGYNMSKSHVPFDFGIEDLNDKWIFSPTTEDMRCNYLYNRANEKVFKLYFLNNNILCLDENNYYMNLTTNSFVPLIFKSDNQYYSFEQFDLKYNRPDLIIGELGCNNEEQVKAFHKAYLKRLKKMGFTEEMLKEDFHLPQLKIMNFEQLSPLTDSPELDLNLNINDSKHKLDRINIYINDVPVYGSAGIDLRNLRTQSAQKKVSLQLAEGLNKVQVSVLNQAGAESYKETVYVTYQPKKSKKPDLYLVTIGDSKYKDSRYNLTYASKDAENIKSTFNNNSAYDQVFSFIYTNEKVTKENILELKEKLKKAGRDDVVMITVAGHGVLDKNLDYYLATYDMDFNNPSEKGIPYEELESMVDGIAPLKKVIFLDACHSGEIDKDEVEQLANASQSNGEVKFRSVGAGIQKKNLGLKTTSEFMKELFTDLRKGTGATVISSAGGAEYAMESKEWKNGLFTYCLLHGLKDKAADENKDGKIMLSELQGYLRKEVTTLSNGAQQPNSRIENLLMDFRVW